MKTNQVDKLLAEAERLCLGRNSRLTPQRREVLRLMANSHGAISAYDLLDQLKQSEPQAKPPTIYRALDFLLEQGFIHKVESSNSYVLCPHFDDPSHISILFICEQCQKIVEKHSSALEEQLKGLAAENQFNIRRSIQEIHGTCHHCQTKQPKP